MKTKLQYENADGEEITLELPAKMVVCEDCEGHGTVLCEGMRNHAYSREEFDESFDDEEREDYFKRGGRYDVPCPTCKGLRTVPAVEAERLTHQEKEAYAEYIQDQRRAYAIDREIQHEREMGY